MQTKKTYTFKTNWYMRVTALVTLSAFLFNTVCQDMSFAQGRGVLQYAPTVETPITKTLTPYTFQLPENLGTVRDSWVSKVQGARFKGQEIVIHIQDAHCNYGCQKKISEIIDYLNKEYGISSVNLEGGAKDYDLSIFTDINNKEIREKTSEYFVKEGLVNGAEYFAINNPQKINLWGIEDADLYMENLKVYRDSLSYKEAVDKDIVVLNHALNSLKIKIYTPEMLTFDTKYCQYKAGSLDLKEYLSYLIMMSKQKALDIKTYSNLYLLSQTLGEEGGIDFKKANLERDLLIEKLQSKLSQNSLEELVKKTVAFKAEQISQKDFYEYLTKRASYAGFAVKDFQELQKYIVYISMYSSIDKMQVMSEVESLETNMKAILCENDIQRELSSLSKDLAVLKNLFNISLTKEDYEYYKANVRSFAVSRYEAFIDKHADMDVGARHAVPLPAGISVLDQYRKRMARFYEYSLERDEAFVRNMRFDGLSLAAPVSTKRLPLTTRGGNRGGRDDDYSDNDLKVAVIVTGGFHTENLCELFKKRGISYVSIMPNFKNCDGYECPYFNILSGKTTNLQQKLYSAVLSASMSSMQVASLNSQLLALKVWDSANIKAYKAAVYIQELAASGNKVTISGTDISFGEGKEAVLSIGELLAKTHEKSIDEKMKEGEFTPVTGAIKTNAINKVLRLTPDETILEQIRDLDAGKEIGIFYSTGMPSDMKEHAGGYGVNIRSDLTGEEAEEAIVHGIVAGFIGNHKDAVQPIADALMNGDARAKDMFNAAKKFMVENKITALWNMTQEQRDAVAEERDFAETAQISRHKEVPITKGPAVFWAPSETGGYAVPDKVVVLGKDFTDELELIGTLYMSSADEKKYIPRGYWSKILLCRYTGPDRFVEGKQIAVHGESYIVKFTRDEKKEEYCIVPQAEVLHELNPDNNNPHLPKLAGVLYAGGTWIGIDEAYKGRAIVLENVQGKQLQEYINDVLDNNKPDASSRKILRFISDVFEAYRATYYASEDVYVHGDLDPSCIVIRPDGTPVFVDNDSVTREWGMTDADLYRKCLGKDDYMRKARVNEIRMGGLADRDRLCQTEDDMYALSKMFHKIIPVILTEYANGIGLSYPDELKSLAQLDRFFSEIVDVGDEKEGHQSGIIPTPDVFVARVKEVLDELDRVSKDRIVNRPAQAPISKRVLEDNGNVRLGDEVTKDMTTEGWSGRLLSVSFPLLFVVGAGINTGDIPDLLGLGAGTFLAAGFILTALAAGYFILPVIFKAIKAGFKKHIVGMSLENLGSTKNLLNESFRITEYTKAMRQKTAKRLTKIFGARGINKSEKAIEWYVNEMVQNVQRYGDIGDGRGIVNIICREHDGKIEVIVASNRTASENEMEIIKKKLSQTAEEATQSVIDERNDLTGALNFGMGLAITHEVVKGELKGSIGVQIIDGWTAMVMSVPIPQPAEPLRIPGKEYRPDTQGGEKSIISNKGRMTEGVQIELREGDIYDGPGANFGGDLGLMEALLRNARAFFRMRHGKESADTAKPRQLIDNFLDHIQHPGAGVDMKGAALEEMPSGEVKDIINELPQDQKPKKGVSVLLLTLPDDAKARRFLETVSPGEGGVRAINYWSPGYQTKDGKKVSGKWTVVMLKNEYVADPSAAHATLMHELRETRFREDNDNTDWVEAHNRACDVEGRPEAKVDTATMAGYIAGRQDRMSIKGASINNLVGRYIAGYEQRASPERFEKYTFIPASVKEKETKRLLEARRHIKLLTRVMGKDMTVKGFMKAIRKINCGVKRKLTDKQEQALDIAVKELNKISGLSFDPAEVYFVSQDSWVVDILNNNQPMGKGGMIRVNDGKDSRDIILVNSELDDPLAIIKVIIHETVHKNLSAGLYTAYLADPAVQGIYSILNEAMTENLANVITDRVCRHNQVLAEMYIVSGADDKNPAAKQLLALLLGKRTTENEWKAVKSVYESERGLLAAIKTRTGSDAPIIQFLRRGNTRLLREGLGKMWDEIVKFCSEINFSDRSEAGLKISMLARILKNARDVEAMREMLKVASIIHATANAVDILLENGQTVEANAMRKNIINGMAWQIFVSIIEKPEGSKIGDMQNIATLMFQKLQSTRTKGLSFSLQELIEQTIVCADMAVDARQKPRTVLDTGSIGASLPAGNETDKSPVSAAETRVGQKQAEAVEDHGGRGISNFDNFAYSETINLAILDGEFAALKYNGGNVAMTGITHDDKTKGEVNGKKFLSFKELKALDEAIEMLSAEDRTILSDESARMLFIDGLDKKIRPRSPPDPENCFGTHYGLSRHQYYLDSERLKDPRELARHLHHEIQERAAVLKCLTDDEKQQLIARPKIRPETLIEKVTSISGTAHKRLIEEALKAEKEEPRPLPKQKLSDEFMDQVYNTFQYGQERNVILKGAEILVNAGFSEARVRTFIFNEARANTSNGFSIVDTSAWIVETNFFKEAVVKEKDHAHADITRIMELLAFRIPLSYSVGNLEKIERAIGKLREYGIGFDPIEKLFLVDLIKRRILVDMTADSIIKIIDYNLPGKVAEYGMDKDTARRIMLLDIPRIFDGDSVNAAMGLVDLLQYNLEEKLEIARPEAMVFAEKLVLTYGYHAKTVAEYTLVPMKKAGLEIEVITKLLFEELPAKWTKDDGAFSATQAMWNIDSYVFNQIIEQGMDRQKAAQLLFVELPKKYGIKAYNAAKKIMGLLGHEDQLTPSQLDLIIARLPDNEDDIDKCVEAVKRVFAKGYRIPLQRMYQYLNASDEKRNLDVMLLDDMHEDVFSKYIEPFLDSLTEEESKRFIDTIMVQAARTKGVDSNGLVSHQRLWKTMAILHKLEISECEFVAKVLSKIVDSYSGTRRLTATMKKLTEMIAGTEQADFKSAHLLRASLMKRAKDDKLILGMITQIPLTDERLNEQVTPRAFLGRVIEIGYEMQEAKALAKELVNIGSENYKTTEDLKVALGKYFLEREYGNEGLSGIITGTFVSGGSWKRKIDNADVNEPLFLELRERLFRGNNGEPSYFDSLKNFERINVLANMIAQKDVLEALDAKCKKREAEGKTGEDRADARTLREYYRALILNSEMKDFQALKKMIMDPEAFLGLDDPNSPKELHNAKKPSRLLEAPYIDINAEDLIDGLILGKLNKFQAIETFEHSISELQVALEHDTELRDKDPQGRYVLRGMRLLGHIRAKNYISDDDIRAILLKYYKSIRDDAGKFASYKQIIRNGVLAIITSLDDPNKTVKEALDLKALRQAQFDINALVKFSTPRYKIRIVPKHEPQAIMTGSEVPTCMKFGSGKNNVYMFNPNTAFLILTEEVNENGLTRDKILATSVITLDRMIPRNVGKLIAELKKQRPAQMDMAQLLGENFIDEVSEDVYVTADNVEILPSARERKMGDIAFDELVTISYKRFFETFFKEHNTAVPRYANSKNGESIAMARHFNTEKVVMGVSYSQIAGLSSEANNYLPQAPVAYSDNFGERSLVLNLKPQEPGDGRAKELNGVLPLSYEDTLETAYIENVAFKDRPGLKNHLAGIEMELIAATYNEALKGEARKNLSLGYFRDGKLLGYMIAYVGYEKKTGKELIYVSDFASLHRREGTVAAGAILLKFAESVKEVARFYKKNFDKDIQVLFQATTGDTGSYRMMSDERLGRLDLTKVSEKDLKDGRMEVILSINPENAKEIASDPAPETQVGKGAITSPKSKKVDNKDELEAWIEEMKNIDKDILKDCDKNIFAENKSMINIPLSEKFSGKPMAELKSMATRCKSAINNRILTYELGDNIKVNFFEDTELGRAELQKMIGTSDIPETERQKRIVTFSYQYRDKKYEELENTSYVVYLTCQNGETVATPVGTCGMAGLAYLQYQERLSKETKDIEAINKAAKHFVKALAVMAGESSEDLFLKEFTTIENEILIFKASGAILIKIRPIDVNQIQEFYERDAEVLRSL